jgi:hypothetical protein
MLSPPPNQQPPKENDEYNSTFESTRENENNVKKGDSELTAEEEIKQYEKATFVERDFRDGQSKKK